MPLDINWKFLLEVEGRTRRGYVPKDKDGVIGQSGVTIGKGIDIGQMSILQLQKLDISDRVRAMLIPYAEKKREAAVAMLRTRPLFMEWADVEELEKAVIARELGLLIKYYNRDSKVKFQDIPTQAQTVLLSLVWNFGADLPRKLPTTWKMATRQEWVKLADYLSDFPGKQKKLDGRRKREAALLRTI